MINYKYVENERLMQLNCYDKELALKTIKNHFKDKRKNCPIPFELSVDGNIVINLESMENLERCYTFFQDNRTYGKAVSESEAKRLQQEFE